MIRLISAYPALGAILLLSACGRDRAAPATPPPIVSTASPTIAPAQDFIELTGVVAPAASIDLVARVSGPLLSKGFADGDQVRQGQVLFRIDPTAYAAEHAVNQARLTQAEADRRRQGLLADGDATSQANLDTARSNLSQAEGSARLSALNLSYATLRAPFPGWIGAATADVGAFVTAGTRLGLLQRIDEVHVEFSVGEQELLHLRDSGALAPGTTVRIGFAGATDFPMTGRLEYADKSLGAGTGALLVRARVRNGATPQLLPGMFVRVRLETGTSAQAMRLPQAVIQSDPLSDYVLVVGPDGKAARRDILTGDDINHDRIIISGLSLSDRVIVSGLATVGVGDKVTVRSQSQGGASNALAQPGGSNREAAR